MSTGTRSEVITECFRDLIKTIMPSICGPGAVASTFTLHRRTLVNVAVAPRDDLGIETRPDKQVFSIVVSNEPCIFRGANWSSERWTVFPEGQDQSERVELYTAFSDIREGDNLVLAFDSKTYLVEASSYWGPVVKCFINTSKAQLEG